MRAFFQCTIKLAIRPKNLASNNGVFKPYQRGFSCPCFKNVQIDALGLAATSEFLSMPLKLKEKIFVERNSCNVSRMKKLF